MVCVSNSSFCTLRANPSQVRHQGCHCTIRSSLQAPCSFKCMCSSAGRALNMLTKAHVALSHEPRWLRRGFRKKACSSHPGVLCSSASHLDRDVKPSVASAASADLGDSVSPLFRLFATLAIPGGKVLVLSFIRQAQKISRSQNPVRTQCFRLA